MADGGQFIGGIVLHEGLISDHAKGGGVGVPLCNTVVMKLYCLTGSYKRFYRIYLFPISTALPFLYLLRLARAKVQVKVS